MSKYIEVEAYGRMLAFGVTLNVLYPEAFLQIDFYKWAIKLGKL